MKMLVGNTGFVGSNLIKSMKFDKVFNSKNIEESYGMKPDLLIYSGVRGTKFLANKYPNDDKKNIEDAIKNIEKINPKKIVLISTVDVYDDLNNQDEDYIINKENLHVYGKNRYELEQWVINNFTDYNIIRLPAIYGINLKKNYIHDLINPCPTYLSSEKKIEIEKVFPEIGQYYFQDGDIYKILKYDLRLINFFKTDKNNALYYTDTRSMYQYLNLNWLAEILKKVIQNDIRILNAVTPSILSSELYMKVNKKSFTNEINLKPIKYNLRTKYGKDIFGVENYIASKETVMEDLLSFIEKEKSLI